MQKFLDLTNIPRSDILGCEMSRDEDRKNRSKRLHKDRVKMKKQLGIAKIHGIPVKHKNKLVKHHAADCGKERCVVCNNPRRLFGVRTIQELREEQKE